MGLLFNIRKQLRNPAFGLFPLLLFTFGLRVLGIEAALFVSLILSVAGFFLVNKYSRLIYDVSSVAFAVVFILSFLFWPELDNFFIFCLLEVIFVLLIIFIRISRARIVYHWGKKSSPLLKNYIAESFRVAFQTQYGLLLHILAVFLYLIFLSIDVSIADERVLMVILQVILVSLIIMETFRLWILERKLHREEWLPVVGQDGNVTGKVAKSVSQEMKNRFMHSVVRVALIHNGMIFLKKRDSSRILNPGLLDYPFEKYMKYDHDLNNAVRNSISQECGINSMPTRFLLKYVFNNDLTKRLIFLYILEVNDEDTFNKLSLSDGRLWTVAQIEDNLGMNVFSECFEMEFEYLKNTVLLAHRHSENYVE